MTETSEKVVSPALDFFAGTVAGMAAVVVGYPFDTVKNASEASIVELQHHWLLDDDNDTPTLIQINLAGAGTGIISSLVTTPAELIKIHQQSLVHSSSVSTSLSNRDVILHIWRKYGLRGFYRGITATALRDVGYGAYFAAYEATLRYWPRPHSPPDHHRADSPGAEMESTLATHSWPALLTAGGLAGVAGWLVTFPFDVVKTRVQSSPSGTADNPYRSTWSTIVSSYRAEGLGVFFRGLAPTLIRAIPVNMVTFTTFEAVVHLCS